MEGGRGRPYQDVPTLSREGLGGWGRERHKTFRDALFLITRPIVGFIGLIMRGINKRTI